MKVPLSWLSEYVNIVVPVDALIQRLTIAGLEVAKVTPFHANWDHIVVGEIVELAFHPDSRVENLQILKINTGKEVITTVASASRVQVGDKVPLALPGARYINPSDPERIEVPLAPSDVYGVRSEGMACSERELHLSDGHESILILDSNIPVGIPLAEALPDIVLEDTILDIELTPNLGRCLSIIGVAREVAALTGQKLNVKTPIMKALGTPIDNQVEIEIIDSDLCSRYCASLIRNVHISDSPLWIKQRLFLAGMRSINNIVDITNFVMLEWGQPLHAFDYDKLHGRNKKNKKPLVIVRRAQPGEKITTLDGIERDLNQDVLLISDGDRPVALAGVMGGLNSEITSDTKNILLESANFYYINNRCTSQSLKLESEASIRYSRGIPAAMTVPAATRAIELMRVWGNGEIASGIIDIYPVKQKQIIIDITPTEVERILGMSLTFDHIIEILASLEFDCHRDGNVLHVTVPDHRLDVNLTADLIEELARVIGYDQIPTTLMQDELPPQQRNLILDGEELLRDFLVGCGLSEVITYSLTNLKAINSLTPGDNRAQPDDFVRVSNPLSSEREYLRHTMMVSMLETIRNNVHFDNRIKIFELGRVYFPQAGEALPREKRRLAIALTGNRTIASWLDNVLNDMDFYDLKGIIETIMMRFGFDNFSFTSVENPSFQSGRVAILTINDIEVGILGEIHPVVRNAFDLPPHRICLAELDLEMILEKIVSVKLLRQISRQPALKEDLAIQVDEDIPAAKVQEVILKAGGNLVREVALFDVYRGKPIPFGKKSLAYSITYQTDRVLKSEDITPTRELIIQSLEDEIKAILRA